MSLKEFDAKQFLLEKGERVGLGVALTLMVAMLVFSLFMPSQGFFSGSPAANAEQLKKSTEQLDQALRTREPGPNDKPDTDKNRLIKLDTAYLQPDNYATVPWFTPGSKENPMRRPPAIYNVEEAVARYAAPPIDFYIFDKDFSKIMVLREKNKSGSNTAGPPGFRNPMANMSRGMMPPQGGGGAAYSRAMQQMGNLSTMRSFNGLNSGEDAEYDLIRVPYEKWNPQELTAHQLKPQRMAIVAASFPYRRQLEEFKNQLRLADLEAVRNEPAQDNPNETSFRFLQVLIQRVEVDAENNPIGDWRDLELKPIYNLYLKYTYNPVIPFQPEDPKYSLVKFDGLVAPLLREFHPERKVDSSTRMSSMFLPPGMGPGGPVPPSTPSDTPAEEEKSKYPDVAAELPKLQDTIAKLTAAKNVQVAAPKINRKELTIDPFRPYAPPPVEESNTAGTGAQSSPSEGMTYPEYCLVRFCDVTIEPGKAYRYRIKIEMANPNYQRDDVASPAYKVQPKLASKEWFEIKDVVRTPHELYYYVVDEKQGVKGNKDPRWPAPHSAASAYWNQNPDAEQVVFQFHRWVEQVPVSIGSKESDYRPVGDWAIADRVIVGRGELIGRRVKTDLPLWDMAKNKFDLYAEPAPPRTPKNRITTGISVDYRDEKPEHDTVLVDFEGGKSSLAKVSDTSRIEVLMLDPDGKLLARNSYDDKEDKAREARRKALMDRVKELRDGKEAR
jgi:hypothetical protein